MENIYNADSITGIINESAHNVASTLSWISSKGTHNLSKLGKRTLMTWHDQANDICRDINLIKSHIQIAMEIRESPKLSAHKNSVESRLLQCLGGLSSPTKAPKAPEPLSFVTEINEWAKAQVAKRTQEKSDETEGKTSMKKETPAAKASVEKKTPEKKTPKKAKATKKKGSLVGLFNDFISGTATPLLTKRKKTSSPSKEEKSEVKKKRSVVKFADDGKETVEAVDVPKLKTPTPKKAKKGKSTPNENKEPTTKLDSAKSLSTKASSEKKSAKEESGKKSAKAKKTKTEQPSKENTEKTGTLAKSASSGGLFETEKRYFLQRIPKKDKQDSSLTSKKNAISKAEMSALKNVMNLYLSLEN